MMVAGMDISSLLVVSGPLAFVCGFYCTIEITSVCQKHIVKVRHLGTVIRVSGMLVGEHSGTNQSVGHACFGNTQS